MWKYFTFIYYQIKYYLYSTSNSLLKENLVLVDSHFPVISAILYMSNANRQQTSPSYFHSPDLPGKSNHFCILPHKCLFRRK